MLLIFSLGCTLNNDLTVNCTFIFQYIFFSLYCESCMILKYRKKLQKTQAIYLPNIYIHAIYWVDIEKNIIKLPSDILQVTLSLVLILNFKKALSKHRKFYEIIKFTIRIGTIISLIKIFLLSGIFLEKRKLYHEIN